MKHRTHPFVIAAVSMFVFSSCNEKAVENFFNKLSGKTYHYETHADFTSFWSDFQKAVAANNRDAVLQMTAIPFTDKYQEIYFDAYGGEKPLTANTAEAFLKNYDKIMLPETILAIQNNAYRGYEYDDIVGGDAINEGEYVLEVSTPQKTRSYNLAFSKVNGVFKLSYMPYYP